MRQKNENIKHKSINTYDIFWSGILQMDILNISWETLKNHIYYSYFCFNIFVYILYYSFVNEHAYKYIVIKK